MTGRTGNTRRTEHTPWQTYQEMVSHALAQSMRWFAFVNLSFSLLILYRNALLDHYDSSLRIARKLIALVEMAMLGVLFFSLALLIVSAVTRSRYSPLARALQTLCLFSLSLLWSVCCYWFVVDWQLPVAYPLCAILMLSALTALYYYPPGLLCFTVPLLGCSLLSNIVLFHSLNLRFIAVWVIVALTLLYGRFILQRWFAEAWYRHQENRLLISRLDTLAHQDALTGTANRRALEDHLNNAVAQQRDFALIMLDVDYFKRYNDHYGHQAGDVCLAAVADVLKSAVRTPEDLVGRYGGEEFVLMLSGATLSETEAVARRVKNLLQERALPHAMSDVSAWVTISMGIALSAVDSSVEQVIAQADAALYRAKEQGRNRFCL